jgi:hypothetical protein
VKCVTPDTGGASYYGAHSFPEEAAMRRLIESLTPDARQSYWKWVGGVFAFYVVLMITAAGTFISHESARKLAHEPATTVAMDSKLPTSRQASMPVPQSARFD